MEVPQNRPSNNLPVMSKTSRLPRLIHMLRILNSILLNPHFHLMFHHLLVKSKMCLRRKQPIPEIQALDLGVVTRTPDVDPGIIG